MSRGTTNRARAWLRVLLIAALPPAWASGYTLSADFDTASLDGGGSSVAGDLITLAGRDNFNPGEWKWLHFRLDGALDKTPQFQIGDNFATGGADLTGHAMVYSYDGQSWSFFDNNQRIASQDLFRFSNASPFTSDAVYVAYGLPYPVSRTADWVAGMVESPWVNPTASADSSLVLGASPGGVDDTGRTIAASPLYGFRVTDPSGPADRAKVVLASGVHANEGLGNLVLEGLVDFLAGDSLEAGLLRKVADFYVYPLVNPDGRYAGMNRGTVDRPDDDPNRFWVSPGYGGLAELATIGAAMLADTAADADYLIDFHSTVNGKTGHYGYVLPAMQSDPLWQHFLSLEPEVDTNNALLIDDTLARFGRDELGADFSITFETQFLAGENEGRFLALGESFALALHSALAVTGDFDLDGVVDRDDWLTLIAYSETDLSALAPVEAYLRGDLDGDGRNSIADFGLFKAAYEQAHGAGAFARLIAIPEPASAVGLTSLALMRFAPPIRRLSRC